MSAATPFVLTTPLRILYQDQYLVAVDKPSGMLVHRSFLDKHETVFVMQTLRDQLGQHVFPVHRLDRPTSGVLLFALSSDVARLLGQQQEQKLWRKYYLAVVRGYLPQGGELNYALKEQLDDIADKFSRSDKAPQQAITRYQPLAQIELPIPVSKYPAARYSLLALQPLTGRKHQLRRHLAHLRHPIVGDTSHGDGKHNALFKQHLHCPRLLLLAKQLALPHPVSGEPLTICAGLNELEPLFASFGWQTDEQYFQQRFAELFAEEKWQKLQ
jgi:tRNA pseudouridine65 synthase